MIAAKIIYLLKKQILEYVEGLAKINGIKWGRWGEYSNDSNSSKLKDLKTVRFKKQGNRWGVKFEDYKDEEIQESETSARLNVIVERKIPSHFNFMLASKNRNQKIGEHMSKVAKLLEDIGQSES